MSEISYRCLVRSNVCSVWNWEQKTRLNRFSNDNPTGSRINEIRFINEEDEALLVTGSSDGVVKIYKDYDQEESVEVVATFRALVDLIPSTKNVGLVLDWQQGQGKFLVAGDVKVIRVWSAPTEMCTYVRAEAIKCCRSVANLNLGNPLPLQLMYHGFDLGSGRRQHYRRWFWER